MFELIPYILELDPETEIKLIEDLEPGKDGLPKMSKGTPYHDGQHQDRREGTHSH